MASMTVRAALAACAVVLLARPATAWNTEQPACPSYFTPFVYDGCYADPVQAGLLFRSVVPSDDMTIEKCAAICKGNNFRYSGLEYYGICYCGNILNANLVGEGDCNTPCAGNPKQNCGGTNRLSVYRDPTFPDARFSVADYEDRGCYTDLVNGGRALGWLANLPSDSMTPAKCLASCGADGLPYAGLEFGGECWCGTVLAASSLRVAVGDCSKPCNGDPSLLCGAGNRLSLFRVAWGSSKPCGSETNVPSSTTTTTALTSTTSSTSATSSTSTAASTSTTASTSNTASTSTTSSTSTSSSKSTTASTTTASTTTASTTTGKPEPPKSTTDKPEPPKSTDKPEPPKSTTGKPEPPKSTTDKPEPPKSTKTESTLITTTLATTTSAAPPICTTVIPSPNYCCGRWCSQDLPDFDESQGCKKARAFCHLQTAACFKYAGWPAAGECHKYKEWCKNVNSYCGSDCSSKRGSCSRRHCLSRHPPKGGPPPVTKTVPCATGTATGAPPTTATATPPVVPEPDGLCIQPTDEEYAYGPGNPVGGIDLPIVNCNNDRGEHDQGKHFKCYSERQFNQSPSFNRKELYKACSLACVEQYDQCLDGYAEGGNDKPQKRSLGGRDQDDRKRGDKDDKGRKDDDDDDKRGPTKDRDDKRPGRKDDDDDDDDDKKGPKKDKDGKDDDDKDKSSKEEKFRKRRCKHQYADCLSENRRAEPQSFCLKYDQQ